MTVLRVRGLHKRFARRDRGAIVAVAGVDLDLGGGETLGLVGESGCGKSTVARLVAGLQIPSMGTIERTPGTRLQMMFQDPYASLDPRWQAGDIIAEPIRYHRLRPRDRVRERVDELLRQVGLAPDDAGRYPHEFSGGQRQRISIARALAAEPALLVCDEPTSALDVSVQAQILNLLKDLQRRLNFACLFISHNLAVVRFMADRIAVMYLGRIVECAPTAQLFAAPRHPYTRLLLDAVPDPGFSQRPRTPIAGEPPDAAAPPPGCAFHPRCPIAAPRCREEPPASRASGAASVACHEAAKE